ncbi:hypothetical protein OKA04_19935 [Luteolibacter flavescens]|uniref:Inovirus Gp2 family protein n=1 Tax=Luteolibacter flavescens TaxID=1859460 RepID=A0ABT3FVM2_9BACT|nr:hypothetical protein [Luteolibacter flavescens]MCW1887020.1 hypothetical protein [Luteolibacter flavescens]
MEIPEIHVLNRIRWQFFGTLTFKSARISDRKRHHMWYAYLRQTARWLKIGDFQRLLWVLRAEEGERTGRFHFHYFLAGLPTRMANPTTCFFLMDLWEELRGGMARGSVFDPQLNAGAYITKDLAASNESPVMRGFHESGKVSWGDCQLTIANSGWKAAANQLLQQETRTRR